MYRSLSNCNIYDSLDILDTIIIIILSLTSILFHVYF